MSTGTQPAIRSRHYPGLVFAAIAALLLVIAAYANHFHNGFHFDDFHAVVNNSYIRNFNHIPDYFTHPEMFSSDPTKWGLRPLVTTSLAIDYQLGKGLHPLWFQLSTFIWYLVLCSCLYFAYRVILAKQLARHHAEWLALIAAAWYSLHTANAETLNYIIARTDVLSTTCIVISFLVFIAWPARRKYMLYVLPAFIGVFAKETVPVLVIILFFYLILFEKELSLTALFRKGGLKVIISTIVELLPIIIVVGVAQYYTLSRIAGIPGISNPPLYYILTQCYVWLHYFITFFLPLNLSADTDWTVILNPYDERIIIGLCFVAGLVASIFRLSARPETRPAAFGLIWFAAALLPTSLAPFAEVTNDHRMFFPFIGLALSVVNYAHVLLVRYRPHWLLAGNRAYMAALVLTIAALNAYGVYTRNKVWRTEESLWYDVTLKSPQNGRGLMNYGVAQLARGNFFIANDYFNRAQRLLPGYSTLYINIGVVKDAMHKPQLAEESFKQAIACDPHNYEAYLFYTRFLVAGNRLNEALPLAEKALVLNPASTRTLALLMDIYNRLHLWSQLQHAAGQVLAILPADVTARHYLQIAQARLGDRAHG